MCSARSPRERAMGSCASACNNALESGPPLKATHSGADGAAVNAASKCWCSASLTDYSLLADAGSHVDVFAVADVAFFRLEQTDAVDQPTELGIAVVARVEVG